MTLNPKSTIEESKKYLRDNFEKGCSCPSCGQFVKLYKRKLTSSMAYGLILLRHKKDWVHVENYFKSLNIPSSIRGDISKLVHWKLIDKRKGVREDGSKRTGYYKITELGIRFIKKEIKVSSHILIYNNKFQGFSDKQINIEEALGNKFNYKELMN